MIRTQEEDGDQQECQAAKHNAHDGSDRQRQVVVGTAVRGGVGDANSTAA